MSDRDTIERAIRHIDSCLDVDPWARDIAIDAMKAQLSGEDTTSDCISRQAALDAVYNIVRTDNWKAAVTMVIMDLPSAQPDLQPTCNQLATDCIGRQAAIDAVESCEPGEELFMIKSLPSVQPEQRWIPCSERLPGRGVSVLVSHVGYVYEDYLDIDDCDGELYFWNSGLFLYDERQNIAWMPLPEPYKGDNQDG